MSPRRKSGRKRLIDLLCLNHPERDRQWLYARILAGDVAVDGHKERDPKRLVAGDAYISIHGLDPLSGSTRGPVSDAAGAYVGRGGDKLAPVLEPAQSAGFLYPGQIVLDAGSSTGGFTDCLLQHGAAGVHAVDVGYNQLDFRLRQDPRVFVRERCNIMSLNPGDLVPPAALAVADLSFRSMEGVAAHILKLLQPPADSRALLLALIKPQFELQYTNLEPEGFDGVLRDGEIIEEVLAHTAGRLAGEGIEVLQRWPAGIPGASGNREVFFLLAAKD
jgi:23S rRNA (cytidine1920-2'-O)/16S rRNA (cytidine1409-2'-O)-methyltransferase